MKDQIQIQNQIQNQILMSDESPFMLEGVDGGGRLWKRRNKGLAEPCISEIGRYGGGASLMVWGGISGLYCTDLVVIQGNLNGVRYRDEILQQQVESFMQNHPEVEMFQHDNTRPHTARVCTAFLADAGIVVMDWPAKSPDINPVDNKWAKVKKRDNPPRNLEELTVALLNIYESIRLLS